MLVWTVVCGLLGGVAGAGAGAGDHLYLSHEGWSRAPVTEEDRRRLLGSFVGSSEAAAAVETDPVLGEVFRQPGAGALRPGRQSGGGGGGDKLLHGFFVTPGPNTDTDSDSEEFSTNFAAADYSEQQVEGDTEYQAEYQAEYPEYQDQHQHQAPHQQQPPPPPPPHVGFGRQTQGRRKPAPVRGVSEGRGLLQTILDPLAIFDPESPKTQLSSSYGPPPPRPAYGAPPAPSYGPPPASSYGPPPAVASPPPGPAPRPPRQRRRPQSSAEPVSVVVAAVQQQRARARSGDKPAFKLANKTSMNLDGPGYALTLLLVGQIVILGMAFMNGLGGNTTTSRSLDSEMKLSAEVVGSVEDIINDGYQKVMDFFAS